MPGASVTVVDSDPARAGLARNLGCAFAMSDAAPDGQELLIHSSGTEAGLRLALSRAAFEARIVEASWFGDSAPTLPLGEAFHSRRLTVRASQVGAVSARRRARRTHADRLALALDLLADPAFDALISGEVSFDHLPTVIAELADGRRSALCQRVVYDHDG